MPLSYCFTGGDIANQKSAATFAAYGEQLTGNLTHARRTRMPRYQFGANLCVSSET